MQQYEGFKTKVQPEWIDHNGHMNVAYYVLVFDWATDEFYRYLQLPELCYAKNCSFFTLDMNVSYKGEVMAGDPLRITTQLLAADAKRIRYFHHMYHAEKGFLAATNECLAIHVDMKARKSGPMGDELRTWVKRVQMLHEQLAVPENSNRLFRI